MAFWVLGYVYRVGAVHSTEKKTKRPDHPFASTAPIRHKGETHNEFQERVNSFHVGDLHLVSKVTDVVVESEAHTKQLFGDREVLSHLFEKTLSTTPMPQRHLAAFIVLPIKAVSCDPLSVKPKFAHTKSLNQKS